VQFQIKKWLSGKVIFEQDADSLRLVVEAAVAAQADLTGAYLKGADLTGAYLTGADLTGAYLKGADLTGAYLKGADLKGADLTGAYLTGADLTGADLTGAYLTGADLTGADLKGADLNEKWEDYLSIVVPALCTAGGRTLEEVAAAWECHSWENCPMHVAFNGAKSPSDSRVPMILRPRVEQFVQLFDQGLIPNPCPTAAPACPVEAPAS